MVLGSKEYLTPFWLRGGEGEAETGGGGGGGRGGKRECSLWIGEILYGP